MSEIKVKDVKLENGETVKDFAGMIRPTLGQEVTGTAVGSIIEGLFKLFIK